LFSLPPRVDLRPFQSPVENQGSIGSCTGQAFAAALEYLDRRFDGKYTDVARLFIYYNELALAGPVIGDDGAYIRDGIKVLAKWGVCDERLWPYIPARFATKPSVEAYKDAEKRRIQAYRRILSIGDLKAAIAEGLPVVFGTLIYESFESGHTTRTGIVTMPKKGEARRGGHAMTIVGYDDEFRWFIVKNSWGERAGDKGYYYIPYEYMEQYASDFWAIYGAGIKFEEEPVIPLPGDTVIYIPIISILRILWDRFWRKKK
jgi:C1A family cysteine protease